MRRDGCSKRRQHGFSLIEILVTLVITAVGLLGLASFVTKASNTTADAAQRTRAAALLNDMASRVMNNKTNASDYVSATVHGAAIRGCGSVPSVENDLCEWNNLLVRANESRTDGTSTAAFLGFRGCVTRPNALDSVFVITVVWGSLTPGAPPADSCASGAFGDERHRRVLRSQVRVARLAA